MSTRDLSSTDEYFAGFHGDSVEKKKGSVALEKALDIRKFEIELYWKRAGYFWTFIGAAFAGYFLVFKNVGSSDPDVLFAINCLGLVFSVAWYFANRGNKYWQLNWEEHVDLLEDEVTGPLYKTVIDPRRFSFEDFTGPYAFSVSKINTILSIFVVFIWIFLAIRTLCMADWEEAWPGVNLGILALVTVICLFSLYDNGRSGETVPKQNRARYRFTRRDVPRPPRSE